MTPANNVAKKERSLPKKENLSLWIKSNNLSLLPATGHREEIVFGGSVGNAECKFSIGHPRKSYIRDYEVRVHWRVRIHGGLFAGLSTHNMFEYMKHRHITLHNEEDFEKVLRTTNAIPVANPALRRYFQMVCNSKPFDNEVWINDDIAKKLLFWPKEGGTESFSLDALMLFTISNGMLWFVQDTKHVTISYLNHVMHLLSLVGEQAIKCFGNTDSLPPY